MDTVNSSSGFSWVLKHKFPDSSTEQEYFATLHDLAIPLNMSVSPKLKHTKKSVQTSLDEPLKETLVKPELSYDCEARYDREQTDDFD